MSGQPSHGWSDGALAKRSQGSSVVGLDPSGLASRSDGGLESDFASSGFKRPGNPAPAINIPATIPNGVRKAGCIKASGCVRAVIAELVEKSFMRSAHLAGKEGSLNAAWHHAVSSDGSRCASVPTSATLATFLHGSNSGPSTIRECRVRYYPTRLTSVRTY